MPQAKPDSNGKLRNAARRGTLADVQAAVQSGADVNLAGGPERYTPLMLSAVNGKADIAEFLLSRGAKVDAVDSGNETALHYAAFRGRDEIVKLLLAKGADPNARSKSLWTPLMSAACEGHANIVRALIAKGARKELKNGQGQTARQIAESFGHSDVAALLRP